MQTDTTGNEKPLMVGNSREPWNVLDSEQGLTFLQCLSSWLIHQIPSECLFCARQCGPALWHILVTSLPLRGQGMWIHLLTQKYSELKCHSIIQRWTQICSNSSPPWKQNKTTHSFKYPVIVLNRLLRKEKAGSWKYCEPW